jgi:hypothetical protein
MLHASNIEYLWKHREEYINVQGVLLDEEQTKYLIQVLQLVRIPYDDCYIRNTTIVARCLESYTTGEHPRDCADKLTQLNKVVAENA